MAILTIAIPFHGDKLSLLIQLLKSIDNQIQVDYSKIKVLVSNDGGMELDITDINASILNYSIKVIHNPECNGSSYNRQILVDNINTTYFTFVDYDDILVNAASLACMLHELEHVEEHDVFAFPFLKETTTGEFIDQTMQDGYLHGKVFRTTYIRKIGLKFLPNIHYHTDTYFSKAALDNTTRIYTPKNLFLLYLNNNSMNKESDYNREGFFDFAQSQIQRLEFAEKTKKCQNISEVIMNTFMYLFASYCENDYAKQNANRFKELVHPIYERYKSFLLDRKNHSIAQQMEEQFNIRNTPMFLYNFYSFWAGF